MGTRNQDSKKKNKNNLDSNTLNTKKVLRQNDEKRKIITIMTAIQEQLFNSTEKQNTVKK